MNTSIFTAVIEMLNYLLTTIFVAMPFVVAILLALGLILLVVGCYTNPAVALWAVMAILLWEVMEVFLPGLNLGIYMYPTDIVFAILALACVLRLIGNGNYRAIPKPWWILGGVMAISFTLGVTKFGSSAGVAFRNDFYYWVGAAYFATVTPSRKLLAQFAKAWLCAAIVILLVVFYRWFADAFGLNWFEPLWRYIDKSGVVFRVVDSGQSLVLGQALIILIYAMTVEGGLRRWRWLVPFLALSVLILQHRSVWIATFVPIMMAFFIVGKSRGRITRYVGVFALAAALILTPLITGGGLDSVSATVASSAEKGAQLDKGTFGFRVVMWQELLNGWVHSNPLVYAIGEPYGSDNSWIDNSGREVRVAPHNYYVQTLIDAGVLGLIGLLTTYVLALRWLGRSGDLPKTEVPASAMFALLICQLLYFIPYSPHYEQGIVLGLALALVRGQTKDWHAPAFAGSQKR